MKYTGWCQNVFNVHAYSKVVALGPMLMQLDSVDVLEISWLQTDAQIEAQLRASAGRVALDVNVILTPPCIFHWRFSIQNMQGGVRMALTSTPHRLWARLDQPLLLHRRLFSGRWRQVRKTPSWPRRCANCSLS
jgi:hypothetical protein